MNNNTAERELQTNEQTKDTKITNNDRLYKQKNKHKKIQNSVKSRDKSPQKSHIRLKLFFKQCLASCLIIFICFLFMRSNFEFGHNCISAISKAVHAEYEFGIILNSVMEKANSVIEFWKELN